MDNKNEGRLEEGRGNVKENVGDAIDNPEMKREGQIDQAKGNIRQGVSDLQDKLQGDDKR
ncbi:MAG: CsbD family protein [Chloroflexota bacterium]|nr:CsbD family protein [Chloroflexota bacterium]MDQ3688700.1 CsbD family protein [Chloroflexota bacterium]MDQ3690068.1 CsbD family protein [Chloroflexota bacterium]